MFLEPPWNRHQVRPEVARGKGPREGNKVGPVHWQGDYKYLSEALIGFCIYKKDANCRHVGIVVVLRAEACSDPPCRP